MAAALEVIGPGKITAVDLKVAQFRPCTEEQLKRCGLGRYADVVRMQAAADPAQLRMTSVTPSATSRTPVQRCGPTCS